MNQFLAYLSIMSSVQHRKKLPISTSTGIISVIIQLFVVDWIVRRFGEAAVLNIFLRPCSSWIFAFDLCIKLYHVLRCYDDYFPVDFYTEASTDDTHFEVSGERARICDGDEQCIYEHWKCPWTNSCWDVV